jgi:hypothetical protein
MRAEDLVQVLLLGAVIFALAGFPKAKGIAIETQAGARVRDRDRGVVNARKSLFVFSYQRGSPLPGGK